MDHPHSLQDVLKVVLELEVPFPSPLAEDDGEPEGHEGRRPVHGHRAHETHGRLQLAVLVGKDRGDGVEDAGRLRRRRCGRGCGRGGGGGSRRCSGHSCPFGGCGRSGGGGRGRGRGCRSSSGCRGSSGCRLRSGSCGRSGGGGGIISSGGEYPSIPLRQDGNADAGVGRSCGRRLDLDEGRAGREAGARHQVVQGHRLIIDEDDRPRGRRTRPPPYGDAEGRRRRRGRS